MHHFKSSMKSNSYNLESIFLRSLTSFTEVHNSNAQTYKVGILTELQKRGPTCAMLSCKPQNNRKNNRKCECSSFFYLPEQRLENVFQRSCGTRQEVILLQNKMYY